MKDIYTSQELYDEIERLEQENEAMKAAIDPKLLPALMRSQKKRKKASKIEQTQTSPLGSGEPYAKRKLALMKLRVHAPRLSREPGYLPMSKPTLKKEREDARLTRKQVADFMGVSIGWLTELERGERALFMPVLRHYRRALRQLSKH
jgi:hypothetical protein